MKPKCDSPRKAGRGPCKNPAGYKTDHVGVGRCFLHGGRSPVKHGRYSAIKRPRIRELLDALEADTTDPLDLLDEVRLLRALTIDYIERYDQFTDALIAWHESYQNPEKTPKPAQLVDVSEATNFLERISRVVERVHKMRETSSVTVAAVRRLIDQMGLVLTKHVEDANVIAAITRDWGGIAIDPHGSPSD